MLHREHELIRALEEQLGHLAQVFVALCLKDLHFHDRVFRVIEHVVNGPGQREDVLTVDRCYERLVQLVYDNPANVVSFSLYPIDLGRVTIAVQETQQGLAAGARLLCLFQ
jgi:hypothetical protein